MILEKKKNKVVVGLSGGVDSSLALFLLKKQGYQLIGVSLKFSVWPSKENLCRENLCCTKKSFKLAKKLCQRLNVPYYLIDCQKEFENVVIRDFICELKAGRTPNPCIVCNQKLRFPKLFEVARKLGADLVATGHYARLGQEVRNPKSAVRGTSIRNKFQASNFKLLMAKDERKDQTYFLYTLNQKQLAKLIFPLGDLTKEEVKKIAKKEKIEYNERESQDFCFVANQSLVAFLKEKIGQNPGPIYDTSENLLGQHYGLYFYTIGQRKGLNFGKKYWVCALDKKRNALIVTDNENDSALFKKEIYLKNYHFISGKVPKKPIRVLAKCRYQQKLAPAILYPPKNKLLKIVFQKPQKAVTPGQSCVFYQNNICLGGGVIDS